MSFDIDDRRLGWLEIRLCRLIFPPAQHDEAPAETADDDLEAFRPGKEVAPKPLFADPNLNWTPGILFFLLRALHRKKLFFLRWEWWIVLSYIASFVLVCLSPWMIPGLLFAPIFASFILEHQAAKEARRLLKSGLYQDLILVGYNYWSLRRDVEAFIISRSICANVFNISLSIILFIIIGLCSLQGMLSIYSSTGFSGPTRMLIIHGCDRGFGLKSPSLDG